MRIFWIKQTNAVGISLSFRPDSQTRQKILVCDDQEDILRVLKLVLRKDYEVLTTSSCKECLEKYHSSLSNGKKVDLLVLDYKMSDGTAQDVAMEVKQRSPFTKVLLITAFELDDRVVSELLCAKLVNFYLKKPFTLKKLKEHVVQILGYS